MIDQVSQGQPPQATPTGARPTRLALDTELRKQMLRERRTIMGGGGPRLETGNTVDTNILNSGVELTLGGA